MNLVPWKRKSHIPIRSERDRSPALLSEFRSELDHLFDRFLRDPWGFGDEHELATGWPIIDVADGDDQITVRAEIPGIDATDVDVSVSGNVLTISGEKKESSEQRDGNFYHCESSYGSFRRSIELPDTADTDSVKAECADGVLTVRVAKAPAAQARHIEVKPGTRRRQTVTTG